MDVRRVVAGGFTLGRLWLWMFLVGPFCVASELRQLAISPRRPIRLSGDPEQYPVTELLGRVAVFQSRLRFTRAVVILTRTLVLCGIIVLAARVAQVITHQSFPAIVTMAVFVAAGWGLHLALHHAISPFEVARLIDRRLGLDSQIATAVEYTLTDRIDRPLARGQIRRATTRMREIDPRTAFPLVFPGRDARILATVAVAYSVAVGVGSMGVALPRRVQPIDVEVARQASQQAQAPSPFVQMDASNIPFANGPAPLMAAPANGPLSQQLSTLQQQLQNHSISPEQYQQSLAQVQRQISQQAQQSLSAQDALNALAGSLKDSSSTQSISDSLNQGNYQKAAQQLGDLGKQLSQLSPPARQQLAQRFDQAAQQTKSQNADISQSSARVSQALNQGDTQQAAQALQDLSKAVQSAGQQVSGQSQLGQAMQNVQQQMDSRGQGQGQSQDQSQSQAASQNPAANGSQSAGQQANETNSAGNAQAFASSASTSGNQASDGTKPGQGQSSGNPAGDPSANGAERGMTKSSGPSQLDGQQSANSGGVGNAPGGNPLGAPQSLDTHGVKVTVVGQPSGSGSSSTKAGDRNNPLTAPDGSTLGATGGSAQPTSNAPINVHQESNQVPIGMKPVVREYFSNDGN